MGGNVTQMAKFMGISRYKIYRWPDVLDTPEADQVRGAFLRRQQIINEQLRKATGGVAG